MSNDVSLPLYLRVGDGPEQQVATVEADNPTEMIVAIAETLAEVAAIIHRSGQDAACQRPATAAPSIPTPGVGESESRS
ncbi:hypothetical protein [Streptomyces sp. Isolate_219]|uniref:hypothetical protein n=1 Tax=Streptomyces sp. Isolate_219 TaxID=2950110 RepID=UPI0021C846E7|nr:hypothetical protein [Streptomyces sp. Isolate_219]MCR8574687.1 hypothetical protein [Streptomyces sp. Isolate_219]